MVPSLQGLSSDLTDAARAMEIQYREPDLRRTPRPCSSWAAIVPAVSAGMAMGSRLARSNEHSGVKGLPASLKAASTAGAARCS